jgi:hypothetical protein
LEIVHDALRKILVELKEFLTNLPSETAIQNIPEFSAEIKSKYIRDYVRIENGVARSLTEDEVAQSFKMAFDDIPVLRSQLEHFLNKLSIKTNE